MNSVLDHFASGGGGRKGRYIIIIFVIGIYSARALTGEERENNR